MSAHPVDLNYVTGEETNKSKYFASWITQGMLSDADDGIKDYGVLVYSYKKEENTADSVQGVGVDIAELSNFIKERHELINKVSEVIQTEYNIGR